jgi:hypothetical protein
MAVSHDFTSSTTMNQSKIMVTGFLLIFVGIQLNLVQTYTLSPSATRFWNENLEDLPDELVPVPAVVNGPEPGPFSQASYGTPQNYQAIQPQMSVPAISGPKQITPPDWLCWPFIFIGAASVFHGLVLRR